MQTDCKQSLGRMCIKWMYGETKLIFVCHVFNRLLIDSFHNLLGLLESAIMLQTSTLEINV